MSARDAVPPGLRGLKRFVLRVQRFVAIPADDKFLLCEALIALTAASFAIAVLPFRIVVRLAQGPVANVSVPEQARLILRRRLRWAILVGARYLPWRAMCFPQGLAAQWMLRGRGIHSVLHYGAAQHAQRGLIAHVWVCDGEVAVIGGEAASGVALLAKFPPAKSSIEMDTPIK